MSDINQYIEQVKKANQTGDYSFIKVAVHDNRFPNVNVTSRCLRNYIGHQKCLNKYPGNPACNYLEKEVKDNCFAEQIEEWNAQVEEGTFRWIID